MDTFTKKVPFLLTRQQIVGLDRQRLTVRAANGAALSRADIVRALIDGLDAARVDLTGCKTEADLRTLFLAKLRGVEISSRRRSVTENTPSNELNVSSRESRGPNEVQ